MRPARAIDALPPLPDSEMAPPERLTVIRPGVVRIDRLGLELGAESKSMFHIEEDDPLSAVDAQTVPVADAYCNVQPVMETSLEPRLKSST